LNKRFLLKIDKSINRLILGKRNVKERDEKRKDGYK